MTVNSGDTSWVLNAAGLVLLMTPALALFYGGMVRTKNVVSTLYQSFSAITVVGVLWFFCGYSLAFSGNGSFIGNLNFAMLNGVGQTPNVDFAPNVPHLAFMIFQAMCAVVTPALITGAFAERIRFKPWLGFMAAWSLLIYSPVTHMVWGNGGILRGLGALDFAGGLVVHMTAGFSALIAAIWFGKRRDFGKSEIKPYDTGMVLTGAGLLFFGWFGFNAGNVMAANGLTAQVFVNTFLAGAAGLGAWSAYDWFKNKKLSAIGAAIGSVAGLITITPASGYVSASAALMIGVLGGFVCNFACTTIKERFKVDDALDVFGCHGVGGTLGVLLTGLFADQTINPSGANGLFHGGGYTLLGHQLIAAGAVGVFSIVATLVILTAVNQVSALRSQKNEETSGLDVAEHGESINSNFSKGRRSA